MDISREREKSVGLHMWAKRLRSLHQPEDQKEKIDTQQEERWRQYIKAEGTCDMRRCGSLRSPSEGAEVSSASNATEKLQLNLKTHSNNHVYVAFSS